MGKKVKQQKDGPSQPAVANFSVKEGFVEKKHKKKRRKTKLQSKQQSSEPSKSKNTEAALKPTDIKSLTSHPQKEMKETNNGMKTKNNKNKKKANQSKISTSQQTVSDPTATPKTGGKTRKRKKKKKDVHAPNAEAESSQAPKVNSDLPDRGRNGAKRKKKQKGRRSRFDETLVGAQGVVDVTEEYMSTWDEVNQKTAERTQAAAQKNRGEKKGKSAAEGEVPSGKGSEGEEGGKKKDGVEERQARLWQVCQDFSHTLKQLKQQNLPDMSAWRDLFVPGPVLQALAEDGFTSPTPIQTLTLPAAIRDRRDIVGAAETGSGKTLAFGIPLLHHVMRFKHEAAHAQSVETDSAGEEDAAGGSDGEESGEEGMDEGEEEVLTGGEDSAEQSEEEMSDEEGEEGSDGEGSEEEQTPLDDGEGIEQSSDISDDVMEDSDDVTDSTGDPTVDAEDVTDESDNEGTHRTESREDLSVNSSSNHIDKSNAKPLSEFEISGQNIETLDIPIGVDLGSAWQENVASDDEDANQSPGEEDEELDGDQEGLGCVRVLNNVIFEAAAASRSSSEWRADPRRPLLALVLTPTRELAVQIKQHIDRAARHTHIQTCVVVGGMAAQKQMRMLRRRPEIVVATPGRLWELIQEGAPHVASVEDIRHLVIDEADRMVERGHFQELSQLLQLINGNEEKAGARQTLVFSATLTLVHAGPNRHVKTKKRGAFKQLTEKDKLEALMAEVGMRHKPKVVDLSRREGTAEALVESRIVTSVEDKDLYIYYFLKQYPGRTLVFANSKDALRRLSSVLSLLQCSPLLLHADMRQKQRLTNLDRFKSKPRGLLLATDVAARGLDIPDVQHVIHFQVPRTSENYVHRSGRTARASREGLSVMLVAADDLVNYRKIIKTLNRNEELPVFPVEDELLPRLRERVSLARQVDKQQHVIDKKHQQNSWFEKAAREADIELEHGNIYELVDDSEDSRERALQRARIQALRARLAQLLSAPAIQVPAGGRYPTQSGKLQLPTWTEKPDAAHSLKASLKIPAPQNPHSHTTESQAENADSAKRSKRKRRAERRKNKKQKLQSA